jgi:hypothetical protein
VIRNPAYRLLRPLLLRPLLVLALLCLAALGAGGFAVVDLLQRQAAAAAPALDWA